MGEFDRLYPVEILGAFCCSVSSGRIGDVSFDCRHYAIPLDHSLNQMRDWISDHIGPLANFGDNGMLSCGDGSSAVEDFGRLMAAGSTLRFVIPDVFHVLHTTDPKSVLKTSVCRLLLPEVYTTI